ncbi:hypothetical protein DFH06DRAFT_1119636 [Mycena polygramma]|nr:hypothetical protein DFH06DRAFT_1119636 [Mycena polygramma]
MDVGIKSGAGQRNCIAYHGVLAKQRQRRKKLDEEREMLGGRAKPVDCRENRCREVPGGKDVNHCTDHVSLRGKRLEGYSCSVKRGENSRYPWSKIGGESVQWKPEQKPCMEIGSANSVQEIWIKVVGRNSVQVIPGKVGGRKIPSKEASEPNSVQAIWVKSAGRNSLQVSLWTGSAGRNSVQLIPGKFSGRDSVQISLWTESPADDTSQSCWTEFNAGKSLDGIPCRLSFFTKTTTKIDTLTESRGERCVLCLSDPPRGYKCHVFDNNANSAGQEFVRPKQCCMHMLQLTLNGGAHGRALSSYFARALSLILPRRPKKHHAIAHTRFEILRPKVATPPLFFVPCPQICAFLLAKLKADPTTFVDAIIARLHLDSKPADPASQQARPFLDLYTLGASVLWATEHDECRHIATAHFPPLQTFKDGIFQPATAVTPGEQYFRIVDAKTLPIGHPSYCAGVFSISPAHELGKHTDGSRILWLIKGRSVGTFLTRFIVAAGRDIRASYSAELFELLSYLDQRYGALGALSDAVVQTEEGSGGGHGGSN